MESFTEPRDFAHPQLGREVTAIGGHYVFGKEIRMPFYSREILYFVGYAVLDSTCCGVGGVAYVLVAGFIKQWKYKKNQDNVFVFLHALFKKMALDQLFFGYLIRVGYRINPLKHSCNCR